MRRIPVSGSRTSTVTSNWLLRGTRQVAARGVPAIVQPPLASPVSGGANVRPPYPVNFLQNLPITPTNRTNIALIKHIFQRLFGIGTMALVAILCLLVSACSGKDPITLRIGTNIWPGYEPLYLARKLEHWQPDRIRLVEYPSATEVMRAFRNHSLEAASLTLDEVLLLRQDNIPVKVVLIHDLSAGADAIVARPGIANVRALKGKRVAVESNALGAFVLSRALEMNGMTLSDVQIIPVDVNAHEHAYQRGDADAVVTFEPARTHLLNAGAHEIFNSRELPNEIVDVLVVHQEYAARYPQTIQRIVDDWFKAVSFMEKDPSSAAHLIAQRLKMTPGEVIASYKGLRIPSRDENRLLLGGSDDRLRQTLSRLNRVLTAHHLVRAPVDIGNLLNPTFVRGLE